MNGNLLRAKVTAALGVLQGQLRADNSRMRVRVASDVVDVSMGERWVLGRMVGSEDPISVAAC